MAFKMKNYGGEFAVAAARITSITIGPLTALAIASRLSVIEQGYYFSFLSILAARMAFDAGIAQVVITTTGQEGHSVILDRGKGVSGPAKAISAVRDILRFSICWYAAAGALMLLTLGIGGYAFFASAPETGVVWRGPWLLFVFFGSVDFALQSFWNVLEGMNKIIHIYFMRSIKAGLSALMLVMLILLHASLWSMVAYMGVSVLVDVVLVLYWRSEFVALIRAPHGTLRWRHDIWPFQWRMAVSWVGGYIAVPLFVPVLFRLAGPAAAGQVGMTMTALNACQALASSLIDAKVPYICGLIASKTWKVLDHYYIRRAIMSFVLFCAALTTGVLGILFLDFIGFKFSARIVTWPVFALFSGGVAANYIVQLEATYLRCHRREPYMWLSLIGGFLTATATFILARLYGSAGVGVGFFTITIFFGIPIATVIMIKLRHRWHSPEETASDHSSIPSLLRATTTVQ